MKSKHIGSDFDNFLREQEMLVGAEAVAAKRVLSFQIEKEMEKKGLNKGSNGNHDADEPDSRGPSA